MAFSSSVNGALGVHPMPEGQKNASPVGHRVGKK